MIDARPLAIAAKALVAATSALVLGGCGSPPAPAQVSERDARAAGYFLQASRVMLHPRCSNCHPAGDSPLQGPGLLHDPPVARGEHDEGVPALTCGSCHQDRNLELARVPGAPKWHLAPREMAWVGKTPHQLCEQLKDPKRNGGKDAAALIDHAAHDPLVAWGWQPGHGREPAPGTQAEFGALVRNWLEAGGACPKEESR